MEIEIESPGDPSCSTDTMEKTKEKHNPNTKEKNNLEQRNGEHLGTREHYANPNCKHASNPYHSCGPYCSPTNSHPTQSRDMNEVLANQGRKEIAKGKTMKVETGGGNVVNQVIVEKKIVNPNCINASNPYHVCADYCLSKAHNKQGQTKGVRIGSKQPSKYVNMKKGSSNSNSNSNINLNGHSKCKNASNPYHNCGEYCFQAPNHDQPPKKVEIKSMKKRNGHSSSVDAFNPPKNQVKAIESNTKAGDEKFMDDDNKRNSWSFNEEDLVEKVGVSKGSEHDLEASYERDLHLREIDSFDFHPQKMSKAEENKKTEEEMDVLQQRKINAPNSYSYSAPNLPKKLPKSENQYKNRKAISSPCSPFHFGLLLISVLYYIAHVIITGAVFPEGKTYARIKCKESEDAKSEGIDTSSC